ncbi:leucine-rich repeat protein [uncultured Alistipes sp.]|uniref:leucine-rich repeat protein n=1 Tax=uncultured Alistipes sp. TaxID=538949 RepID=UPI002625F48D|nr:leucine-rich repeat protein [uncultured Alistipes sp.]
MKVKSILIGIAAALAAVSCNVEDEAVLPGAASDGLLKIRPRLQQLDVQTRNAENALIAYIPDSLKSARVQPIASSMIRENVYYYNLPEAATSVLFTNLASTAEENVRFGLEETGGLMVVLQDSTRAELSQEILLGGLSGILAGNATPYDVSIRRLSSKITARLVLTDANGTPLENTAEQLLAASVAIDSLGTFVRIHDDFTTEGCGYTTLESTFSADASSFTTPTYDIIPGRERPRCRLTITDKSGTVKTYTKELDQPLEANRNYMVTFRLRQVNGSVSFTFENVSVDTYSTTAGMDDVDMFSISGSTSIGKQAGDSTNLYIASRLNYAWDYELRSGSEYFSVLRVDDMLTVKALSDNESEARVGVIRLTSSMGDYRDVTVNQSNAMRQAIRLTKGHSSTLSFYVDGTNVTITGGNFNKSYETCNNTYVSISNDDLPLGEVLTISGDELYSLTMNYMGLSYQNSYAFENCTALHTLEICSSDATLDVSALPALTNLSVRYSLLSSVTFAKEQPVSSLSFSSCSNIESLDLTDISATLRNLTVYSCSKFSSLTIYPSDFSGEKPLEEVNFESCNSLLGMNLLNYTRLRKASFNSCRNMGTINLSGCSSIYEFHLYDSSASSVNLSNCTSMQSLRLQSVSLGEINLTGTPLSKIDMVSSVTISKLDLSGMTSLKTIEGNFTCPTFNASGCTSMDMIDSRIYSVKDLNVSGCSSLTNLSFSVNTSNPVILNFSGLSQIESLAISDLNVAADLGTLTTLKTLSLSSLRNVASLDLSACASLETFSCSSSTRDLTSLVLPQSLQSLSLDYSGLETLSLAGYANLKDFRIVGTSLQTVDLSGCTALVKCNFYNNSSLTSIDLGSCSSLAEVNPDYENGYNRSVTSINLSGCSSLTKFSFSNAALTSLDLSSSPLLSAVNVKNNSLDADGVNNMLRTLPDRSSNTATGVVYLYGNPGVEGYDTSIVANKNWYIDTTL